MTKNRQIQVQQVAVTIIQKNDQDFISLSDIANGFQGGTGLIEKWIRNKNTLEFLGVWEILNNPVFNSTEFEGIKNEAGVNRFMMSVKQWIERTGAVGMAAKAGRYGGTYAHKDIALEFCSWISPEFKLFLIKEFERLKEQEKALLNEEWDLKRLLSKVNYRIHTDSIKENVVPKLTPDQKKYIYQSEADLLNLALFGMTANEWKQKNPKLAEKGGNIRDYADLHELTVLSNLESYNSMLNMQNLPKEEKLVQLRQMAVHQLNTLRKSATYNLDRLKSPNLKRIETENGDSSQN